ncbi:MAG: hypothetical protein M3Q08_06380 [Pseudomonadota bacterium]|nr:hypothetical protein [Pseudomonadota bacterium]
MAGFLDWAGRVVMLVLAGMITLSIIGAIAAIPSSIMKSRMRVEPRAWPIAQPERGPQPLPARPGRDPAAPVARQPAAAASGVAPPPEAPADAARWLEAITYALLALVGLGLLLTILLWRALGHWRRSADALEILAHRRT